MILENTGIYNIELTEDNIDNVKCKITNYIPKGLKTPKEALENEFYKIFSKYITKNP